MTEANKKAVIAALFAEYPNAKPELDYNNAFELLIAAILSAQCSDVRVNIVTATLFTRYPCAEAFATANSAELEEEIKTCGLYRTKAKNIIATCKILAEKYNGDVPRTLEELTLLPGVGRKVANVVLSNAFCVPAIAVDTHVFRVANRIGLAHAKTVLETEKQLMAGIDRSMWSKAHHLLIFHGRRVCKAIKPMCNGCVTESLCEYKKAQANNAQSNHAQK